MGCFPNVLCAHPLFSYLRGVCPNFSVLLYLNIFVYFLVSISEVSAPRLCTYIIISGGSAPRPLFLCFFLSQGVMPHAPSLLCLFVFCLVMKSVCLLKISIYYLCRKDIMSECLYLNKKLKSQANTLFA